MALTITYIIGFIATFIALSIEEHRLSKKVFLYEVSLLRVIGWSIIWPLSAIFIVVGVIHGLVEGE